MLNKAILIGNLGRDPEMRYMQDGTAVTNLSVATTKSWTDRQTNERVKQTTWFRVSVWGKQAESANQYLQKGRQVYVEGEIKEPNVYTKKDGTAGASLEVKAERVLFLGSNGEYTPLPDGAAQAQPAATQEADDIPF